MNDAYGDGWNGAGATFTDGLGDVMGFAGLDGVNDDGASGTATIADDPLRAVVRGTGIALKKMDQFTFLMD